VGFDVRTFVATQLGCTAADLVLIAGPADLAKQGQVASYARRPSATVAAKVLIGPCRSNLAGRVRRLVTVSSRGTGAGVHTDIGADEPVHW
jgi:hypothetical protein